MYRATVQFKTTAVLQLVLVNIVFFIAQALFPAMNSLALNSANWLQQPWTLVSAMFLHSGFSHLLFNMYALFIFGPLIEARIGKKRFLWAYFGSGILASLGFVAYRELILGATGSAVGASGAVMGILGLVIMLFPKMKVLFFFVVPMSMRTAGIIFALIDLFGAFNPTSGIAHVAHLAGLASGLLYGSYLLRRKKKFQRTFTQKPFTTKKTTNKKYEDTIELTKDDLDQFYKSGRL